MTFQKPLQKFIFLHYLQTKSISSLDHSLLTKLVY